MLALSYALILWLADSRFVPVVLAAIMGSVAVYIATRPRPRDETRLPHVRDG